jgi:hypothetical protein
MDGRHAALADAIARALSREFTGFERKFYTETLVFGGADDPTRGKQRILADLLREIPDDVKFDMAVLESLIHMAVKRGGPAQDLAARLDTIRHVEGFIAPAASVFEFILARDRKPVEAVASAIRDAWGGRVKRIEPDGVAALRSEFLKVVASDASADRLVDVARALADGDYEVLVHLLAQHNAAVMRARGGSQPWVSIDGGRLNVRMADESGGLAARETLPTLWRNSYFIEALRTIRSELDAGT